MAFRAHRDPIVDANQEDLIQEVKKRPEVWNVNHEHYNDKVKKRLAWESISAVFCEDFEQQSDQEKNRVVDALMKRWRNMKDTYLKTIRKSRCGYTVPSGRPNRPYVYAKHLSFLGRGPSIESEAESEQTEFNEASAAVNVIIEEKPPVTDLRRSRRNKSPTPPPPKSSKPVSNKRKRDSDQKHSNSTDEAPSTSAGNIVVQSVQRSQHQSFFDSLLPIVEDFTNEEALDFRMEVLQVARKIQRARREENQNP